MASNPNDFRSAAFRAANDFPTYQANFGRILAGPRPKAPARPRPLGPAMPRPTARTVPRTVNSPDSSYFRQANAPDQSRPAARPVAPPPSNAYTAPSPPGVGAALAYAQRVATGGGGGGSYTGLSASDNSSLAAQARQMVGYELDPQIKGAQLSYNQENRDYGWLIRNLNRQTGLAKTDISSLFGALDQLLGANQQQQKAAYTKATTDVGANYDQLSTMLDATYGKAQTAATAEQQRLGIAGPGQNDRLNADKAYLTGLAGEQKANALSNVATQGANAGGIAGMMRSSSAEAAPHLVAQVTMAANEQQQTLLKQHIDSLTKYKDQIGLLNAQRPGKVAMVLKQLQDQLYQRQQDALQLQFLNGVKSAELGISAGQLQLAQARLAQDGKIATDRALLEAQKLAASGNTGQTGMERAFNYLGTAYPDKSGAKQGDLQDALIDAINGNSNDPGFKQDVTDPKAAGYGVPGYNANYLGTYLAAIDAAVNDRASQGWGPIERNILRNAVMKFFGK